MYTSRGTEVLKNQTLDDKENSNGQKETQF